MDRVLLPRCVCWHWVLCVCLQMFLNMHAHVQGLIIESSFRYWIHGTIQSVCMNQCKDHTRTPISLTISGAFMVVQTRRKLCSSLQQNIHQNQRDNYEHKLLMVSAYTESGKVVLFMCAQQIHFIIIPSKTNHTLDHYSCMFLNRLPPAHSFIASIYWIVVQYYCIAFMLSVYRYIC